MGGLREVAKPHPPLFFVLLGDSARGVNFLRQVRAEHAAEGREIFHGAQGDELTGDVANGGAFECERDHGNASGVGGGLAK